MNFVSIFTFGGFTLILWRLQISYFSFESKYRIDCSSEKYVFLSFYAFEFTYSLKSHQIRNRHKEIKNNELTLKLYLGTYFNGGSTKPGVGYPDPVQIYE